MRKTIEEAAIEAAEAQYRNLFDPDVSEDGRTVSMFASMFERGADFALSSRWTRVEDGLPELMERVLVRSAGYYARAKVFIAKRVPHDTSNADDKRWHWTQVVDDDSVTHWCHIPALPDAKEGEI